jgi:hypothetical protein
MYARILFALLAMPLAGCATVVEPVPFKGPHGGQAYSMNCSGAGRTLEKCYKKSGELCPNGYDIVSQNSSTAAIPLNGSLYAMPQHNLSIECK